MLKMSANQFFVGTLWKLVESILSKSVSVILTFVLARLLSPSDYGVIVLAMAFIYFAEIFIDRGFNIALIRKPETSDVDYSTAFCVSFVAATVFYITIYVCAPRIALYYDNPAFSNVLRTIALLLFFQPCITIITARAIREIRFKHMSIITFICSVAGGAVGIYFALCGYGVWALVWQQLVFHCARMLLLIAVFRYKFPICFSLGSAKSFYTFSSRVIGTSFLDFTANKLSDLCIGKVYPPQYLGYLNRGSVLPEQLYVLTFASVNNVMLPALASRQNDPIAMKNVLRRILSVTMYFIIPMLGCLAVMGKTVIVLLMTEKWEPSAVIMQWYCICYGCQVIRTTSGSVFYSLGKSGLAMKVEIFRCMMKLAMLVIGVIYMRVDLNTFIMLDAFVAIVVAVASHLCVWKEINYSFTELIYDLVPPAIITAITIAAVTAATAVFSLESFADSQLLVIQSILAVTLYLVMSYVFKVKAFLEAVHIVSSILKKRN